MIRGLTKAWHLAMTVQVQGRSFVAAHSIHALAVLIPVAVIVLALYWDRLNRARRRWTAARDRLRRARR